MELQRSDWNGEKNDGWSKQDRYRSTKPTDKINTQRPQHLFSLAVSSVFLCTGVHQTYVCVLYVGTMTSCILSVSYCLSRPKTNVITVSAVVSWPVTLWQWGRWVSVTMSSLTFSSESFHLLCVWKTSFWINYLVNCIITMMKNHMQSSYSRVGLLYSYSHDSDERPLMAAW